MPGSPDRVLFGAAYYVEYQPPRPAQDRPRPDGRDAHFSVIRRRRVGLVDLGTGERHGSTSTGSSRCSTARTNAASRVILGTPTYAVPPWLARQYPEIAGERATGQRHRMGRSAGGRLHPPRVPVPRRAGHPRRSWADTPSTPRSSASRWTTSPGIELLHNHGVFQRFVDHLRRRYGDVETLNQRVGAGLLVAPPVDLGRPVDAGRQRPAAVRPRVAPIPGPPDHRVHRLAGRHRPASTHGPTSSSPPASPTTGPAVDDDALTDRLDVAAGNPYYVMQDAPRAARSATRDAIGAGRPPGSGRCSRPRTGCSASRQAPFLVTETNATSHRLSPGTTGPRTTASGGRPPGRSSRAVRG